MCDGGMRDGEEAERRVAMEPTMTLRWKRNWRVDSRRSYGSLPGSRGGKTFERKKVEVSLGGRAGERASSSSCVVLGRGQQRCLASGHGQAAGRRSGRWSWRWLVGWGSQPAV